MSVMKCLCAAMKPECRQSFARLFVRFLTSIIYTNTRSPKMAKTGRTVKATGYQDEIMTAWCDWVTVNHWGVEAAVIPINKGEDGKNILTK